jgi:hypothetical protein
MEPGFVNFSIRLTLAEREELARLAAQMQRKPSDAVRVIIRKEVHKLHIPNKTAPSTSSLAGRVEGAESSLPDLAA